MTKPRSAARNAVEAASEHVVRAYVQEKASIREIADQFPGSSYGMVREVLVNAGVVLRGRGGARGRIGPLGVDAVATGAAFGLRQVREMAGLTQAELSLASGIGRPNISHIETRPIGHLSLASMIRLVEGCGARLLVTAEFDADTYVLYDTYGAADGDGDGDGPDAYGETFADDPAEL